jgi:LPXTG-motif cell wall-anchored protein
VTPIVSTPGANQLPPSNAQAVQKAPVAGIQRLPSTSTDSAGFPLSALGLALMAVGGMLLRRRGSRSR